MLEVSGHEDVEGTLRGRVGGAPKGQSGVWSNFLHSPDSKALYEDGQEGQSNNNQVRRMQGEREL